nr:MAG TPA: hypothetical protein [Caudoviricetes sp.]
MKGNGYDGPNTSTVSVTFHKHLFIKGVRAGAWGS